MPAMFIPATVKPFVPGPVATISDALATATGEVDLSVHRNANTHQCNAGPATLQ